MSVVCPVLFSILDMETGDDANAAVKPKSADLMCNDSQALDINPQNILNQVCANITRMVLILMVGWFQPM